LLRSARGNRWMAIGLDNVIAVVSLFLGMKAWA
jgi:hypothetical protein